MSPLFPMCSHTLSLHGLATFHRQFCISLKYLTPLWLNLILLYHYLQRPHLENPTFPSLVATDGSNDDSKLYPIVFSYFSAKHSIVKSVCLSVTSLQGSSTGKNIEEMIVATITEVDWNRQCSNWILMSDVLVWNYNCRWMLVVDVGNTLFTLAVDTSDELRAARYTEPCANPSGWRGAHSCDTVGTRKKWRGSVMSSTWVCEVCFRASCRDLHYTIQLSLPHRPW
ncbi:hypothetical protein PR048_011178 [Dryococelus australis]|uniref:Uncharacterized protein n=1 Tax=Dryococelus australis TaxID=614101 RepID=A0ABQ9HKW8_9NEOP|nr:hypothetical protein PR048_011178 [Dryococelus australis]